MRIKELVTAALADIGVEVFSNVERGQKMRQYIVFVVADERPELCGDDEDETETCYLSLHYYDRGETDTIKKLVRRRLRQAGFVVTSTTELYEDDTKYNHVIIAAEISGAVDD